MPFASPRALRPLRRFVAALIVLMLGLAVGPALARATTVTLSTSVIDGAPAFNGDNAPGHDNGPANGVVRTNDIVTYTFSAVADTGQAGTPVITVNLPAGVQMFARGAYPPQFARFVAAARTPDLPAFCGTGSQITTTSGAPLADPSPAPATQPPLPEAQTITCVVTDPTYWPAAAKDINYDFTVMVRPEATNNLNLAGPAGTFVYDSATGSNPPRATATATAPDVRVSAAAQWNVSVNGSVAAANSSFIKQGGVQACASRSPYPPGSTMTPHGVYCYVGGFPIAISVPNSGRGGVPAVSGDFQFRVKVDPVTLWGAGAAGLDPVKFGGYLGQGGSTCDTGQYDGPYSKIGAAPATAANAVRNSGTVTCTQPGGPGTDIIVTVTGADSTAFTTPQGGVNTQLVNDPAEGYIMSQRLWIEFPTDGIFRFGTGTGTVRAPIAITATEVTAVGVDGRTSPSSADRAKDSTRRATAVWGDRMGVNNFWAGVPGAPTTTPPAVHSPGYAAWWGPSGPTGINTGDGVATPGQRVLDTVHLDGYAPRYADPAASGATTLTCTLIDPSQVAISDFASPAGAVHQAWTNDGQAASGNQTGPVWISGSMVNYLEAGNTIAFADRFASRPIAQYAAGDGTECSGTTGWYATPAEVPGNDPALAAKGIYTAVTRVRVFVQNRINTTYALQTPYMRTTISMGMTIRDGLVPGTLVPTRTGYLSLPGTVDLATMADPNQVWTRSDYDPAVNANPQSNLRRGDRLTYVARMGRIVKTALDPARNADARTDEWLPASQTWRTGKRDPAPEFAAGDTMRFTLTATLTAATDLTWQQHVRVADCLPEWSALSSASVAPSLVTTTPPADALVPCPDGRTYVEWDLGMRSINTPIAPIAVSARVIGIAHNGT